MMLLIVTLKPVIEATVTVSFEKQRIKKFSETD